MVRELMPTPQNQYYLRSADQSTGETLADQSAGETMSTQSLTSNSSADNSRQNSEPSSSSSSGTSTPDLNTTESSLDLSDLEGTEVSDSPDHSIMAAQGPALPPFHGNAGERAEEWLMWFGNFTAGNGWNDTKKFQMLPLYFKDHAHAWYVSLADNKKDTLANLTANMKLRFNGSDGLDVDMAILTISQEPGESCNNYFSRILKVTAGHEYQDSLLYTVALKGLNSNLKAIVMPQGKTTLEELRKAAVLAEKTVAATMVASSVNSVDVNSITEKVLSDVSERLSEVMAFERGRQQSPAWNNQQQQQPQRSQQRQDREYACMKCQGRTIGTHYCGAQDKQCSYCGRKGHFTETCRSRDDDIKKGIIKKPHWH